jgi:hypothetical protein
MGRRSRDKGARTERSIVAALKAAGFAAVRVPLSGAVGGRFGGDVVLPVNGRDLRCEVKCRGDGFRKLYDWLDCRDVLIAKADRREPLVIVRLLLAADVATLPRRNPMHDRYERAVEALRPLPPDERILALAESVERDREAVMQRRDRLELPLKHMPETAL